MHPRRTFVVRVRATTQWVVLEDVQTGERVRLSGIEGVEEQIQAWVEHEPPLGVPCGAREDSVSSDT